MLKISKEKFILDVCCGGRMMWFNKKHPNVLYLDIRTRARGFCKERKNFCIQPDFIADYTDLKIKSESFELVVWDPPHCIRKKSELGVITKKYGSLGPNEWRENLTKGFSECFRVLKNHGVLIFKWNEQEKKLSDILKLFPVDPLFGHTTGSRSKTHWLCFIKINLK